MNKKIFIGVIMVIIFVTTAFIPIADNSNNISNSVINNKNDVRILNNKLSFFNYKSNVLMWSGNNLYKLNWDIYKIKNSSLIKQNYKLINIKSLNEGNKNVIINFKNNNTYMSEIYCYYNNGISSNLLIKNNNNNVNKTYVAAFTISSYNIMKSLSFKTVHNNFNYNYIHINSDSMKINNLKVSWDNSISIFDGGIIKYNNLGMETVLPFGSIHLVPDETYEIDPYISLEDKTYDNGLSCFPVKSNKNAPSAKIWGETSSGAKLIGVVALAVYVPNGPRETGTPFEMCESTSVNAKSGYTVNKIEQALSYVSNSENAGNEAMYIDIENSYYQDHESSKNIKTVVNALFTVASAIASIYGIPVINPFDFLQHGTPDAKYCNGFSKCYNAGKVYNKGLGRETYNTLGITYWNWDWPFEHFKPSYMFGFYLCNHFKHPTYDNHNINNPVGVKFQYSVSLYLTNRYGLFHTTTSIDFTIGQYGEYE